MHYECTRQNADQLWVGGLESLKCQMVIGAGTNVSGVIHVVGSGRFRV
jgi:hypothetical protein